MAFGRYFEEFEPGALFQHWPGRTISEADDTWFCLLTMNQHPLHIDAHYASATQHGQRLVVGTLVFSIAVRNERCRHQRPCDREPGVSGSQTRCTGFHGDTIYAETRILEKQESRSKPDRGIVHVETGRSTIARKRF